MSDRQPAPVRPVRRRVHVARTKLAGVVKWLALIEPVLKAGTVQAVVALVFAFGVDLSPVVTGWIEGGAAAVLGVLTGFVVEEALPAAFTGLMVGLGTLAVAYGVENVTSGLVSAVYALLAIVMASLLREKVSEAKWIRKAKMEVRPQLKFWGEPLP
jgi:hypothetical protein